MHCIGRQTVEQTLSLFGSSVVQYAIFWYLVLRSNSGMVMTGAMVAAALPQAIVSVFGGVWADRWKRKLLVMFPDAVIAAVTICLSASMAVGWGDTGLILVVLVIRSAGGGIQTPAVQSFIPQIVPEAWLLRVNAINGTLQTAISIASPAIAAALVNLMPLWMIMLVDVSTAIVGIGFVARVAVRNARKDDDQVLFGEVVGRTARDACAPDVQGQAQHVVLVEMQRRIRLFVGPVLRDEQVFFRPWRKVF